MTFAIFIKLNSVLHWYRNLWININGHKDLFNWPHIHNQMFNKWSVLKTALQKTVEIYILIIQLMI
jgi:hypothetical protein